MFRTLQTLGLSLALLLAPALARADISNPTSTQHVSATGSAPAISSCGTGAAVTGGGSANDNRGFITTGTGTVNSCTLTFAVAYAVIPACVAIMNGSGLTMTPFISAASTTAITVSFTSSSPSTGFIYICLG
jgi:hypothetical protein